MAEGLQSTTIALRERSQSLGSSERLPKWLSVSFVIHVVLIACLFITPLIPSSRDPIHPVYTVDLVGGDRIGKINFGTELTPAPKQPAQDVPAELTAKVKEAKTEKAKTAEITAPTEEKPSPKEKSRKENANDPKMESSAASASADIVRERLLQSAVERAKNRNEGNRTPSKGESLSAGSGEGEGAAALGPGGRGGPGVVKGMDFVIYQNRMLSTIKDNWAWVGQRANLKVVVHFGIKENGEIVGLKVVQPSSDPSYDESVLRAVKKSNPLPAPPESFRKDFAEVELTFRPRDLGA